MANTKDKMVIWVILILVFFGSLISFAFEKKYDHRVYPRVAVNGINFGGQTQEQVEAYWVKQNKPFSSMNFEFRYGENIATVSGRDLDIGYDATLSAKQAYLVGRSGYMGSDIVAKFVKHQVNLTPFFRWKTSMLDDVLNRFSQTINIPRQNALFRYEAGKVISFKASHDGKAVNSAEAKKRFVTALLAATGENRDLIQIELPVDIIKPSITTDHANGFGIKDLIGRGYSQFHGSLPGRIHNVALAASRINGILIKPGETFSFNDAVGDISAATGYQSAYIIKEGKTVLGDGGGVCQVSTTLFRAALAAGLPILARTAHDYRVHYYEEGGFKPGLDATVFGPSTDLVVKNDTPGYILIQTKMDSLNSNLTFELYGTSDGRIAQILNQRIWDQTPPPPDLHQDDPTLPKGEVKQVDFSAWGAKAAFDYKVMRNGQALEDTTFTSNFKPWQAVYLHGV